MNQSERLTQDWHLPSHIHPLLHDGGMIYFNSQTGRWGDTPRRFAAVLLKAIRAEKIVDIAWAELTQSQPDAARIRASFVAAKLLMAGKGPHPFFVQISSPEGIESLEFGSIPATRTLSLAEPAITDLAKVVQPCLDDAVRLIHHEPFPYMVERLEAARGPNAVPATMSEAQEAAQAVRQLSDWYPGKFDCLEHAAATALVGARAGLQIDLQLGVSVDPNRYHAWPATQGRPVVLPGEPSIIGRFHPIFAV